MGKFLTCSVSVCAFTVASVLFSDHSRAAITYDESIDGDLPDELVDTPVFAFDVGTHTVTGTRTFSNARPQIPGDANDSFRFTIPALGVLDSVRG